MDAFEVITALAGIVFALTILLVAVRALVAILLTINDSWVKPITYIGALVVTALTLAAVLYAPDLMQAYIDGVLRALEWAKTTG